MKFYETDFWFITKLFMTGFVRLSYGDPSVLVTGHLLQSSLQAYLLVPLSASRYFLCVNQIEQEFSRSLGVPDSPRIVTPMCGGAAVMHAVSGEAALIDCKT